MSSPRISVALSVYNAERFLAEAIESILAQTFADFEFLILDDGSGDSSRAIAQGYAQRDSRIRLIARENRGLIKSLNQLIDEARAPLIARMDADDIAKPERFARQLAWLEQNPNYGVVGTWSEDVDEHGRPLGLSNGENARKLENYPVTHEDFMAAVKTGDRLICHPTVIAHKDVLQKVGGYHAAFKHCEDLDLWLRLANETRIGNVPERLLCYRHNPQQVSSRHITEQLINATIANIAYEERAAGRPDPTASLAVLPPLSDLNILFGRDDVVARIQEMAAMTLRHSRTAMGDNGFNLVLDYIRNGGSHHQMWRTVARLATFGTPSRALRLAGALVTTRPLDRNQPPGEQTSLESAA